MRAATRKPQGGATLTVLAVLADIHGNLPALEAVTADLEQCGIDHVVVAGDLVNWGPFSAAVLDRVVSAGWTAIRGNNELYVVDDLTPRAKPEWADRVQYALLPLLHREMEGRWHRLLTTWPDTLCLRFRDAPPLRIVHGSPRSAFEGISWANTDEELAEMCAAVDEATIVAAHTHLQLDRTVGRWRILNPGSVGNPLDGDLRAGYMLLRSTGDGWEPELRRVPFDYAPLFAEFERQRWVEQCSPVGVLVVDEYRCARPRLSPFLRWRHETRPSEPISAELVARFKTIDPWPYTARQFHVNRG